MKTGFWKALIGSCSGTAVFAALRKQHLGRAFWHLCLMLLICSALMTFGWDAELRPVMARTVDVFAEECGGVRMDENGMTPLNEPEKMHTFLLPGPCPVTYLPMANFVPDPMPTDEEFTQGAEQGLIWLPGQFILWHKTAGGYTAKSVFQAPPKAGVTMHFISASELLSGVRQFPEARRSARQGGAAQTLTGESLRKVMSVVMSIVLPIALFFALFLHTSVEVLLYVLMFAGVSALMNVGKRRKMGFKELLKLEIYAGFPAMLIGSAAEALNLPYLEFNFVYVLGMTLYLVWILNRLNIQDETGHGARP